MTRVLVIDDHTPSRMHLSRILPQCGYEIAEAASGKSAVVCACIERAKGMLMEQEAV
jgi:CheY-like chemotaxis protein